MRIQQFNRGEDESHLRHTTVDQKMPAAGCTYSPCHEPLEKVALELEPRQPATEAKHQLKNDLDVFPKI